MNIITKTLLLALALSGTAQAQQVELTLPEDDSVIYEYDNIAINNQGHVIINGAVYVSGMFPNGMSCGENTVPEGNYCVGTGGSSSSSSESSSSSVPSSSCGAVPSGTRLITPMFNWNQYTAALTIPLPSNGTTLSFPVQIGLREGAGGSLSAGGLSWTSGVGRELWISECPGGAPLSNFCTKSGSAAMNINWIQGSKLARCELQTNKEYYVNMRNTGTCTINSKTPNCNAFIQHKPSGSID